MTREEDPVTDMREYGTHNQPKGTWSDDSSMMLATLDSMVINGGIRYEDIMERFLSWKQGKAYTAHGRNFDIGITCSVAIDRYAKGTDPLECGGCDERSNGNGSLMRIMPVSLFYGMREDFWNEDVLDTAAESVHNVSRLTHGHSRSMMACMFYTAICHELVYRGERSVMDAVQTAVDRMMEYYANACGKKNWCDEAFEKEIQANIYRRLRNLAGFKALSDNRIESSGYVVHTLEAAIWCLLNTDTYAECTLRAVNLGDDTDTVGAVAGGLAGLTYGYEGIPKDWLDVIAKAEWIDKLCVDLAKLM